MTVAKLTLSVPPHLITSAKQYAYRHGKSLSGLISGFLENLTNPSKKEIPIGPRTRQMTGLVSLRKRTAKSDRDLLTDSLLEKHR